MEVGVCCAGVTALQARVVAAMEAVPGAERAERAERGECPVHCKTGANERPVRRNEL